MSDKEIAGPISRLKAWIRDFGATKQKTFIDDLKILIGLIDEMESPPMPPIKPAKSDIRCWFVSYYSKDINNEPGFGCCVIEEKFLDIKTINGFDITTEQIKKSKNFSLVAILNFIEME